MRADRRAESGRVISATRQEIADPALDLVCAIEAADGLDGQHAAQPGPRAQSFQGRGLGAGEHPAANQAAMGFVKGIAAGTAWGATAKAMLLEVLHYRRMGQRMIAQGRRMKVIPALPWAACF